MAVNPPTGEERPGEFVEVPVKSIWASKTFWVNVLAFAIAILMELSQFADLVPYARYILLAITILNIALRSVTQSPVTLRGK